MSVLERVEVILDENPSPRVPANSIRGEEWRESGGSEGEGR